MVLSAVSIAAHMLASAQQSLYASRYALSSRTAAYDLAMQLERNHSSEECLSEYMSNGSLCMYNYTRYYGQIYGIGSIGVISSGSTYNYSSIYCYGLSAGLVCVGVS